MLPVEAVLPELKSALGQRSAAVLTAPPGAGKTTVVPLALLEESWLRGLRIVMLEPRRLAARAAAYRMAYLRAEKVGGTIGYRVRMDTKVSSATRIEVVTEGVLTRMLQDDPSLEGVGLLIFDEFHERSLQADLGLALALESQHVFRDDLRILVMSATLEAAAVARILGDAPVVTSEGRIHPVETHYLQQTADLRLEERTARTVRKALREHPEGDILVFLPGAAEIRRTRDLLEGVDARVHLLFGSLSQQEQDAAIEPSVDGVRKVVLATDIAETSLTIEGIRIVVDGGVSRVPRFSPRSGMTRLMTIPVSKASADQRRGRAGRLGPGVCYRLWTRQQHLNLEPHSPPEITQVDLAQLALELARWGATDAADLRWLDPPPQAALDQARGLLVQLGALHPEGHLTPHGRQIADAGIHPRYAHMILEGERLGNGALACEIAALLGERDIMRASTGFFDADIRSRLHALRDVARGADPPFGIDARGARHVLRVAEHWKVRLVHASGPDDVEAAGLLVALAYPERIAQNRDGRFRLRSGRAAVIPPQQPLADAPFLAIAELGGSGRENLIYLAAPITRDDLEAHFAHQIESIEEVVWDRESAGVRARRQSRLGALVLSDAPLRSPDPDAVAEALIEGIRENGIASLPWTKEAIRLRDRMSFMHYRDVTWPDVADSLLLEDLSTWLKPHLFGLRRADELQRLSLAEILLGMLTWEQRRELDERAPSHVPVPSGSRIAIDYSDPQAPVLAVRLQEMFGAVDTPRIDRGRVPLTLHLLSPAQRPVQVTQDLTSFWREAYFDVRKDLRGRYPKHYWPENPLEAEPTSRAKPRK